MLATHSFEHTFSHWLTWKLNKNYGSHILFADSCDFILFNKFKPIKLYVLKGVCC